MKNIRFKYLYRDAGNFKLYSSVVFTCRTEVSLEDSSKQIQASLIDEKFFVPESWDIPRLSFEIFDFALDHEWHIFEGIELTLEDPTDNRDFADFLHEIMIAD